MKTHERLHYEKVDYTLALGSRVVNYTVRTPEELVSDEVVLDVPGIMAKRRLYNPHARDVAERGVTSVTMAHEGASPLCTDEVVAVVKELAEHTQNRVRLVGHSLGGMNATRAALIATEYISGLLLMQPAGYGGVHPRHALSSLRDRPDNHHVSDEIRVILDGFDYFISSKPHLLLQTVIAASRTRVADQAQDLPEHITRDALLFPHDRLIIPSEVSVGLAQAGFSLYSLDERLRSGHNAIMYRSDNVAEATVDIITTGTYALVSSEALY
jgi:pimeloyl-ACP methyl ester carboxylesterase